MPDTAFICVTCGCQFPPDRAPPAACPICEDPRQYVGHDGQQWIAPADLQRSHRNRIESIAPGLYGIGSEPGFAIGQRALLLVTPTGNILWDCISLIDADTVDAVNKLGGIDTIAISHPHFYAAMLDWARAFDARIVLHAADREWVMRDGPEIEYWDGETRTLAEDVTLIRTGGHFAGATVLHRMGHDARPGIALSGDTVQVAADRDWVSFMYSYPNMIPLSAFAVTQIAERLAPYRYDHLYGGWWDRIVLEDADIKVQRSARRYRDALAGAFHGRG